MHKDLYSITQNRYSQKIATIKCSPLAVDIKRGLSFIVIFGTPVKKTDKSYTRLFILPTVCTSILVSPSPQPSLPLPSSCDHQWKVHCCQYQASVAIWPFFSPCAWQLHHLSPEEGMSLWCGVGEGRMSWGKRIRMEARD